jgi:hypothetical protein
MPPPHCAHKALHDGSHFTAMRAGRHGRDGAVHGVPAGPRGSRKEAAAGGRQRSRHSQGNPSSRLNWEAASKAVCRVGSAATTPCARPFVPSSRHIVNSARQPRTCHPAVRLHCLNIAFHRAPALHGHQKCWRLRLQECHLPLTAPAARIGRQHPELPLLPGGVPVTCMWVPAPLRCGSSHPPASSAWQTESV